MRAFFFWFCLSLTASSVLAKDIYLSIGGSVGAFRTDMRIVNPSTSKDIQVQAYLLAVGNTDNSSVQPKTITVPKRQMVVYDDVLTSLFNTSGLAAIRLRSDDNFIATQRIYATVAGDTLGQFVPGLELSAAKKQAAVPQLKNNGVAGQRGTFRTNIGAVNPNAVTANVTWRIYDKENALVGTKAQTMPPYAVIGPTILTSFADSLPAGTDLSDSWFSYTADQSILVYGSVVDNGSTDPTFISAFEDSGVFTTATNEINTSVGVLVVTEVQTTDRFPPGCTAGSPGCGLAQSGFKVLIVWLSAKAGGFPNLIGATSGVNVTSSAGVQTNVFSSGLLAGRLFVAFTPRTTDSGFSLNWPGNSPVDLGV